MIENSNKKSYIWQVALIGAALFFMFLASSSYNRFKKTKYEFEEKKTFLLKENLQLKDRLDSIQALINQKTASLNILEEEKKNIGREVAELEKENNRLMSSQGQVDDLKEKNAALKIKIAELETNPVLKGIKESMLSENDKSVRMIIDDALGKIELIKEGKAVSLEPILVRGSDDKPAQTDASLAAEGGSRGTVLSIDRKDNLVVISLGSKDGVREGAPVIIFKNDKKAAEAKVVSIRSAMSAALIGHIDPQYTINSIEENDIILIPNK